MAQGPPSKKRTQNPLPLGPEMQKVLGRKSNSVIKDSSMTVKCSKVGPHKSAIWDSTLGCPGEGPGTLSALVTATQNMNGSLTGNAWNLLLKEAKRLQIDHLLIQENNLKVDDPRLTNMYASARNHGFAYCHIACVPGKVDRGGTATLISDRVEVTKVTSIDRLGGAEIRVTGSGAPG